MTALVLAGSADLVAAEPQPADQNPALVYLASLRGGPGRRTMRQALNTIAQLVQADHDIVTFPWAGLRFQHTAAIRSGLAERYAPATANKMLAALRGTLKSAWRLGQMTAEEYQRAADLPPVKGESLLRGRALSTKELGTLFRVCAADDSPAGARDGALLAVLYGAGLRRAEVAALDLDDYDPETGELVIRAGKGHKSRVCYVNDAGRRLLARWLIKRGEGRGALFQPISRWGRLGEREMTPAAVYQALARRAEQAGVREFSPHDLRRTCISDLLDAGVDMATVQKLAGHSNVSTTARYDRRGETAKRRAAGQLRIPEE